MNRIVKTCIASVVSEIKSSDIYLTVKARLFETPGANLNGVRVTPAFLSEIVEHQDDYVGLPLCADVKALANGNYQHLGHLYDARTGEFHSAQIGSFYQFEEEKTEEGAALIGYARILKRNKAVCRAISELFADNALKFSFEISCGSYRELEDGTIEIDASEDNFLEGAAVVTFPACQSAVALDLVAELTDDGKEGENMTDVNENVAIATSENKAETEEDKEVVAEAENPAEPETEAVEHTAEADATAENAEETAELVVTETHYETDRVEAYDTDTGAYTEQTVSVETRTTAPVEPVYAENEVAESAQNETVPAGQAQIAEDKPAEDEEPEDETASKKEPDEKCAETETVETAEKNSTDAIAQVIAELKDEVAALRKELAELKAEPAKIVAEAAGQVLAETNPFMDSMTVGDQEKKYRLLESDKNTVSVYTLL